MNKTMRNMQILLGLVLVLLCGLPAHAGYWTIKEYQVEKYIKSQEIYQQNNGKVEHRITGFGPNDPYGRDGSSPQVVKEVVQPGMLVQFYANLSLSGRQIKVPATEATYSLCVTPVFEWVGQPNEVAPAVILYKELCRVEVSRSHSDSSSIYSFSEAFPPYDGRHFTFEQSNPWDEPLYSTDHTTPHGGVIRSANLQYDMCQTWKLTRVATSGTLAYGESRRFNGRLNASAMDLVNSSHFASIGVVYEAKMAHFSLDVSAPDATYLNSDPWNREINAYASRAIIGGALDSTPESTIESLWVGGVGYSANLSSNLLSHFGDIKYDWNSSSDTLTSQHFPYGRELGDWPNYGANSPIHQVPDEEWIYKSTRTKNVYHDLGKGETPADTTVELKVTDTEKPESELIAKAKINWHQQPSTSFEIEVETVGIDLETGAEVNLDSGGEYSSEEAQYAMRQELRDTINGGSQIAGTALEVAGDLIMPDLYDVAVPVAGAAAKRVYKFTKGAARLAAITSRVRGLLSSNSGKLMATARARLGKGPDGPVLIRIRTKETITGQKGKLPTNSSREKLPDKRVTKKTSFLGQACFVSGTLIETASGPRAIENLKKGDLVWARDEASGTTKLKRITQTYERVAPSTLVLRFSNGDSVETTVEHPFYVQDKGFVPAGLVALGNSIVTRAGPPLKLIGSEEKHSPRKVFNFSVEDFHTYFVGSSAIWVHNVSCNDLQRMYHEAKKMVDDILKTGKGSKSRPYTVAVLLLPNGNLYTGFNYDAKWNSDLPAGFSNWGIHSDIVALYGGPPQIGSSRGRCAEVMALSNARGSFNSYQEFENAVRGGWSLSLEVRNVDNKGYARPIAACSSYCSPVLGSLGITDVAAPAEALWKILRESMGFED